MLQFVGEPGALDILDADWMRIDFIRHPWGMPFNRLPVLFGKAAPRDKAHDAIRIEQQYGRSIASRSPGDSGNRSFVDLCG
nr:hypothetical protein [Bradyrhizobium japonicum]